MALTKSQFMSQPLAGFVTRFNDSNYEVAKKIKEFFDDRDHGKYAVIVSNSDDHIYRMFKMKDGKYRDDKNINGKNICVWKQLKGDNSNQFKDTTVKALARGLIIDHNNDVTKVRDGLEEVLGGIWAVCYTQINNLSVYTTYNKYFFDVTVNGNTWKIWRQA